MQIEHAQNLNIPIGDSARPTSISIDWVSEVLYFIEADKQGAKGKTRIVATTLDGRYKRSVVTGALENPTSLALNPATGNISSSSSYQYPFSIFFFFPTTCSFSYQHLQVYLVKVFETQIINQVIVDF